MASPQQYGQHVGVSQHSQQLRQIVGKQESKDFRQVAQDVKQAVSSNQLPQQYSVIADIISRQYDRLPETERQSLKDMPGTTWAALFEVADTLVQAKNHLGQDTAQTLGSFYAQTIEECARQPMPSGFSGGTNR